MLVIPRDKPCKDTGDGPREGARCAPCVCAELWGSPRHHPLSSLESHQTPSMHCCSLFVRSRRPILGAVCSQRAWRPGEGLGGRGTDTMVDVCVSSAACVKCDFLVFSGRCGVHGQSSGNFYGPTQPGHRCVPLFALFPTHPLMTAPLPLLGEAIRRRTHLPKTASFQECLLRQLQVRVLSRVGES